MDWWFYGRWFEYVFQHFENHDSTPEADLWIFENRDYESKNRPGNHRGVFLFVMTAQHGYFVQWLATQDLPTQHWVWSMEGRERINCTVLKPKTHTWWLTKQRVSTELSSYDNLHLPCPSRVLEALNCMQNEKGKLYHNCVRVAMW
jgi:hypothetical protein